MGKTSHLNSITVAMLLFKGNEASVDFLRLCFGNVVQSISENSPCPLIFLDLLLKLGELDEELLLYHDNKRAKTPLPTPNIFAAMPIVTGSIKMHSGAQEACFC